ARGSRRWGSGRAWLPRVAGGHVNAWKRPAVVFHPTVACGAVVGAVLAGRRFRCLVWAWLMRGKDLRSFSTLRGRGRLALGRSWLMLAAVRRACPRQGGRGVDYAAARYS